jgi:hypothetical protein
VQLWQQDKWVWGREEGVGDVDTNGKCIWYFSSYLLLPCFCFAFLLNFFFSLGFLAGAEDCTAGRGYGRLWLPCR